MKRKKSARKMLDEGAGYEGQRRVEPRQDEGRVLARKELLILAVCRASVEVLRVGCANSLCPALFFVPYHERCVMQTGSPGERRRGTCGGVSQRGLYFTAVLVSE